MIASVSGTVIARRPGELVIEAAGVGYRLVGVRGDLQRIARAWASRARSTPTWSSATTRMQLYGFATEAERELFLMLIGVQGVGPKVALAVLSGGRPRELLNALAAGDSARFQAVPGIGKRTAERIIVELREKVAGRVSEEIVVRRGSDDDPRTLARDGLMGLGFSPQEVDSLLQEAEGSTPEDLIAAALRGAR